jgi:2'-5' RNA ligase superfamily protein
MAVRLVAIIAALLLWTPAVQPVFARADIEQAKATGGIVALYPSDLDAHVLAIPGGTPPEELHLTLVDYGQDVSGLTDVELRRRLSEAQVFGHAVFNPNDPQRGPSTVYIVGDSAELASLRQQVLSLSQELFEPLAQHEPWVPHVTAGYSALETDLKYTGTVRFDRIGLSWAGCKTYWPL